MVVVGWLGSGTTTLHCTHYVLTHRLKVSSLFSLCFVVGRDVLARPWCLPILAFGQDVQLSIAAVRPLDLSSRSRLVVRHLEREHFDAKARERLSFRQSVWLQVFRVTIGTDIADVVVAMGENCDLMYGRTEFWIL